MAEATRLIEPHGPATELIIFPRDGSALGVKNVPQVLT